MINILYVSQPYYIGGAEIELLSIIKGLDRRKFNPIVLFTEKGPVVDLYKRHGVKPLIVPLGPWDVTKERLFSVFEKNRIDIVHTNTMRFFEAAMAAKLAGISSVWRIHTKLKNAYPRLRAGQIRRVLGLIFSLSDGVISCSEFAKRQFKEAGLSDNFPVANCAVDTRRFRKFPGRTASRFRKRFGIGKDDFLVGMACRLEPQKRPEEFIRAASIVRRKISNAKFVLVGGNATPSYLKGLLGLNRKSNNPVIFTGFYKNIPEVMGSIDLLVNTALNEVSSIAVIEGMAAGKPVVAMRSGEMSNMVKDGKTGALVAPGRTSDLAATISVFVKDPQKAHLMGEKGRIRAVQFYDINVLVKNLEKFYHDVLKNKNSCR